MGVNQKKIATSKNMHHMRFWRFLHHHITQCCHILQVQIATICITTFMVIIFEFPAKISATIYCSRLVIRSFLLHLHVHLPSIAPLDDKLKVIDNIYPKVYPEVVKIGKIFKKISILECNKNEKYGTRQPLTNAKISLLSPFQTQSKVWF